MRPRVNKWLDFLDRVGGTAVQVGAGAAIAALSVGMDWKQVLVTTGSAILLAVLKVLAGQNTGTDDTGAVIGNVIEPPPTEKPNA